MDMEYKNLLVSRILAGYVRCRLSGVYDITLLLYPPSSKTKYIAQEIYFDTLEKASTQDLPTEDQIMPYLLDNEFWSLEKQSQLDSLPGTIEDLKVKLFGLTFKSMERASTRKQLEEAKKKWHDLLLQSKAWDIHTRKGVAELAKNRYIVLSSLRTPDGKKLYPKESFFHIDRHVYNPEIVYQGVMEYISENHIQDEQFRELARTEPWRVYWGSLKHSSFFANSDEQLVLMSWSRFYDSIFEHPEAPHSTVIEDDDMLDGWAITQRRKRENEQLKKEGEDVISKNPKIQNAKEIFIPVDTFEDAQKINILNDTQAKIIKMQRMAALKKQGSLPEHHMPDTQMELRMLATQQQISAIKGGK